MGKVNHLSKEETENRLQEFNHLMNGEILGQKKLIRNFSAGNKQKVGIISTLITSPEILILDEPFNFLDPTSQNLLKKMIESYSRETGATVIISSHNLTHTVDISTRILLMEHGELKRDIVNIDDESIKELNEYFQE